MHIKVVRYIYTKISWRCETQEWIATKDLNSFYIFGEYCYGYGANEIVGALYHYLSTQLPPANS